MTLADVLTVQAKYHADYIREFDKEHALVDAALREKSRLPDNYWQARHVAQRKLEVVNAVVEALREA